MATQRERVAAYRAALTGVGATELRMPMATPDAIALARELAPGELRHGEVVGHVLVAWDALPPAPPAEDFEAQIAHARRLEKACTLFWEAFEGQIVDGVEIIRRR